MISSDTLRIAGLVFAGVALAAALVWLASALRNVARKRRLDNRGPGALNAVAAAVRGGSREGAIAALRGLGEEGAIAMLVGMAEALAGEQRRRLDRLAEEIGLISRASRWARSSRWHRRLRAARLLAFFGGADEVVGLALLGDPNPDVRAEAALWAGRHRSPDLLRRLVELLDDPAPRCRVNASEGLRRAGSAAVPPLAARLAAAPAPTREAFVVAGALAVPEFMSSAIILSGSRDPRVRAEAASLIAAIGGSTAGARLTEMLRDEDPRPRAAACTGLGALGRWDAASEVARLLEEKEWGVRRAAAEALRRMGPTGELLLRRSGRSGALEGARTARSALGLPPAPPAKRQVSAA